MTDSSFCKDKRRCAFWALPLLFLPLYLFQYGVIEHRETKRKEGKMLPSVTSLFGGSTQRTNNSAAQLKIVHVVSPFKIGKCDPRYCPFDQAQSVTIASMQRARNNSKHASVLLAAAVFSDTVDVVPSDFLVLDTLNRSTTSEYPNSRSKRNLPFVDDILRSLRTIDMSFFDYDFVVYTNIDIIVRDDFYDLIANVIKSRKLDGFSINRQVVPKSFKGRLFTRFDLDKIYALKNTKKHPGDDCFVLKKSVLEKMRFGDVFLGYPPIGAVLLLQAQIFSDRFRKFASQELKATYHLGRDTKWNNKNAGNNDYKRQNAENAFNCVNDLWQNLPDEKYRKLRTWKRLGKICRKFGYAKDNMVNSTKDFTMAVTKREPKRKRERQLVHHWGGTQIPPL